MHPDLLGDLEEALSRCGRKGADIALLSDPAMARGDVAASWRNGCARRDTAALGRTMRDALAGAGLLYETIFDQGENV